MKEFDDPSELTDEERATLVGQSMLRVFKDLSELDTAFKKRLDEPLTEFDRGRALCDQLTTITSEVFRLWGAIEALARRLGIEELFEEPTD